jgi:hypothetical protein
MAKLLTVIALAALGVFVAVFFAALLAALSPPGVPQIAGGLVQ